MKGATLFLKILGWVSLIGFVLLLLSSSSGQRPAWNPIGRLVIELTAPVQNLIKKSADGVADFWMNYFQLVQIRQENIDLKATVNSLKMENNRYRERLSTHERTQELLQFKQTISRPVLAAQVVGLDPTGWFKSVIINKGSKAGLGLDMPVVDASGVVGKIVSFSSNYAKVLLIIDQNSAVDCLVQRSRDRGMIMGLSAETCKLNYVVKSSEVTVEDRVVTSGLGGIFPKGLPVGEVLNVADISGKLFKDIEIRPAVDFSKLEEVLVILKENESSAFLEKED